MSSRKDVELVSVVDPDAPNDTEKKPNSDAKASLAQLFSTADSFDLLLMAVGSFGGLCTGLCMPAFNVLFGEMLDELNSDPNGLAKGIANLSIMFVYLACVNLVCGFLQVYCWSYTGERQTQKLRERYVKAILSQEVGWFDEVGAGELSTRVADLSGKVQDGVGRKLGDFFQYVGQLVGSFGAGFYLSWQLTLVLMAGVPLIGAAGAFMITSVSEAKNASFETYAAAGGVASETFNGIRTVTALNNQPSIIARYRTLLVRGMDVGILKGRNLGLGHGGLFGAAFLLYALGFWYGAELVADDIDSGCTDNCVTGGAIMSTFFCVIMGSMALGALAPPMTALVEAQCAALPMVDLIERKPIIDSFSKEGAVPTKPSVGRIELREVTFAYPTRPTLEVCKGYNLVVEPGETLALVGHSGSGKSTIMNLLLRFYDPLAGEVLLDGSNLKELNIQWLRSQYGYVGQEPVLFHGTIADNILDSIADANGEHKSVPVASLSVQQRKQMEDAARMANAHEFISAFPQGFDTDVGSNGTQLSGGQKQRIAIARALVRKPAVLLLDEATSALDATSERQVQQALDQLHNSRAQTTIVIAHRLSTIRNADKIAVVNAGHIAEIGTHDELVDRPDGIYADLIRLQMSGHEVSSPDKERMRARSDSGIGLDADKSRARTRTESAEESKKGAPDGSAGGTVVETADGEPVVELSDSKKSELRTRIWGYILQHRLWLVAAVLGAATFGAVFPVWGLILSVSQDMFFLSDTDEMRDRGATLALLYIALSVTCVVSCLFQYWGTAHVGERVMLQLRSEMFESVIRREISYFDRPENSVGALTTRLSEDARLMQRSAAESLAKLMQAVFTLLIGIVLGMLASWQIALVVLATFPLNIIASGIQMAAMAGGLYDKDDGTGGEGAIVGTAFTNVRTISAFSLQNKVSAVYNQITNKKSVERIHGALIAGVGFGASGFLLFLSYALLFWYGSTLIEDGKVTFQEMMQAIMCLMLGTMGLGQALNDLADQNAGLQAAYRVFMAIDEAAACPIDALSTTGSTHESVTGRIELRNVSFAYPSRPDVTVCKGYSLVIEPGQVVALVGPSGSGKSTIMNLLLRFYDPLAGEVLLDGHEVRDLNIRWLRNQIGYVGQEPTLFSGSVAENIAKGRPQEVALAALDKTLAEQRVDDVENRLSKGVGGADNDIVDATTVSNAHEFISAFPQGYNTDVGEGSVMVSGGQKQRIAIARALVRKPAVLLLDEATSALDTESEQLIQAAIDKLQEKRAQTTIIIAHRLSTIKNADKIAVLDAGEVVEVGTHDELVEKPGGLYAKLWARQTGEKK